ncbi:MAG: hypothetical protein GY937_11245 [bacterium]|nr:hypothetical protein [bacterium]
MVIALVLLAGVAGAEEGAAQHGEEAESLHHLSVILGATDNEEATGFTLGLDYEYEWSERVGFGAVLENAFGDVDALVFLAVADLHLWRGLTLQTGPGVEFIHGGHESGEREAVFRLGLVYEFEFGQFFVAPQAHYDFTPGVDSLVVGVGIAF